MGSLIRTTIFLTEDQHERLRRLAFEQRTSMAKLLRDAAIRILSDGENKNGGKNTVTDEKDSAEFQNRGEWI